MKAIFKTKYHFVFFFSLRSRLKSFRPAATFTTRHSPHWAKIFVVFMYVFSIAELILISWDCAITIRIIQFLVTILSNLKTQQFRKKCFCEWAFVNWFLTALQIKTMYFNTRTICSAEKNSKKLISWFL